MVPKVIDVKPLKSYFLQLEYENGEKRFFDIKPYCTSSYFSEILDWNYFVRVRLRNGTIEWPNEQDIAPETLYFESNHELPV